MKVLAAIGYLGLLGCAGLELSMGWAGIEQMWGWGWALVATILALWMGFTLPLTIGVFFGVRDVMHWHWSIALLVAFPTLVFMVPGVVAGLVDYVRSKLLARRDPTSAVSTKPSSGAPITTEDMRLHQGHQADGGVTETRRTQDPIEVIGKVIVFAYRRYAAANGPDCAPTAKTSDARVKEIYTDVVRGFRDVAMRRSEEITAQRLNFIAWKFMQVEEMFGPGMVASHVAYETKKYLAEGLRKDYQHELPLFPESDRSGGDAVEAESRTHTIGAAAGTASKAHSPKRTGDRSGGNGLAAFVISVMVLIALVSATAFRSPQTLDQLRNVGRTSSALPARVAALAQQQKSTPRFAIASIKANVRRGSSTKSPVLAMLDRGTSVEPIAEAAGFVKIILSDGQDGWVAKSVLVDGRSAVKLMNQTAEQYALSPERAGAFTSLVASLRANGTLQKRMLDQIAIASPDENTTVAEFASTKPAWPNGDPDGSLWFGLEAKWAADNGSPSAALIAANAAVAANPVDADGLVALGFAAINAGEYGQLSNVAFVLPMLAPQSANTWLIVAVSAAARGEARLADGAIDLALQRSRNTKVTRAFIANMASNVTNGLVTAALLAALEKNAHGGRLTQVTQANGRERVPSCAEIKYGTPEYHARMADLVRAAGMQGLESNFHKYHEALVSDLCRGDARSAAGLVRDGFLGAKEAEAIRKLIAPHLPRLG